MDAEEKMPHCLFITISYMSVHASKREWSHVKNAIVNNILSAITDLLW